MTDLDNCKYITFIEQLPLVGRTLSNSFLGADMIPSEDTIENLIDIAKMGINEQMGTDLDLHNNYCIVNIIRLVFMISYCCIVLPMIGGFFGATAVVIRLIPGLISAWKAPSRGVSFIGFILIVTTLLTYYEPIFKANFTTFINTEWLTSPTETLLENVGITKVVGDHLRVNEGITVLLDILDKNNNISKYFEYLRPLGITMETLRDTITNGSSAVSLYVFQTGTWVSADIIRYKIINKEDIWKDKDFNKIYNEWFKNVWQKILITLFYKHHSRFNNPTSKEIRQSIKKTNEAIKQFDVSYESAIAAEKQKMRKKQNKGLVHNTLIKGLSEELGDITKCSTDKCRERIPAGLQQGKNKCVCESTCGRDWTNLTKFGKDPYCRVNGGPRYCGFENGPELIQDLLENNYARCNEDIFKKKYYCDTPLGYKYCKPNSNPYDLEEIVTEPYVLPKGRSPRSRSPRSRSPRSRSPRGRSPRGRSPRSRSPRSRSPRSRSPRSRSPRSRSPRSRSPRGHQGDIK